MRQLTVLILIISSLLYSCETKSTTESKAIQDEPEEFFIISINAEFAQKNITEADSLKCIEILKERISLHAKKCNITQVKDSNMLHITFESNMYNEDASADELLQEKLFFTNIISAQGKFSTCELYNSEATVQIFIKIREEYEAYMKSIGSDSLPETTRLLDLRDPSINPYPGVLFAQEHDTAFISNFLKSDNIQAHLPPDFAFSWTRDEDLNYDVSEKKHQLIAYKVGKESIEITNNMLDKVSITPNEFTGNDVLNIELKKEYHTYWENMTKANLKKQLVIVIDNIIYSYPTVQSPISGGKSQITGIYNKNELLLLETLLSTKVLPLKFNIINYKTELVIED